jgi:hypothetical protein
MNRCIWILEQNDDNRAMALEALGRAGVTALPFATPESLLFHAQGCHGHAAERPLAAIIDAKTARGDELAIREAIGSRLIVLTTWPPQIRPWLAVGVSRFLLKPYTARALLDHVDPLAGFVAKAGLRHCAMPSTSAA